MTATENGQLPREKVRRDIDQSSCCSIVCDDNEVNSSASNVSTRMLSCVVNEVLR